MDPQLINKLIAPFTAHFDETYKKYYYFNTETNESIWKLPDQLNDRLIEFQKQYDEEKENILSQDEDDERPESDDEKKIMEEFLEKNYKRNYHKYKKELVNFMTRPARKQLEKSLASGIAYRQGDEEYNIWYDKFLTDVKQPIKEREAAQTRMNPDIDTGYTKADLYEKFSSYFCMHFAKGSCCEGANCKYFHRVPSYKECMTVDNSRDIFGRPRFSKHKEDMAGIGSFMVETRTLQISEFKIFQSPESLTSMYEIIWRHFSVFGEIDDIVIKQASAQAYIRFQHRCMAEFSKEAMQNQTLDKNEVLLIKWAKDTDNSQDDKPNDKFKEKNESKILNKAMEKKQKDAQQFAQKQALQQKRQDLMDEKQKIEQQETLKKRYKKMQIHQNVSKMNQILESIDTQDQSEQVKNALKLDL